VLEPPGQARADWSITAELSSRFGYPMDYDSPEEIFAELASLAPRLEGLTYGNLGFTGKLWPCPDPAAGDGLDILFDDQFPTASGRGKLVPCPYVLGQEEPDEDHPFVLNTGRELQHWHTGTMTRRVEALDAIRPDPAVRIHPDDLAAASFADGDRLLVNSRRGSIEVRAQASADVQRGSLFIPFHYREAAANVLTTAALDPFKIPEFKFCAVKIERG